MPRSRRAILLALCAAFFVRAEAAAQTTTQLWANVIFNWTQTSNLSYELEFEPKILLSGPDDQPDWRALDVTSNVEYAIAKQIDLVGEFVAGQTHQTDDLDTTELTLRTGARFHLFSRLQEVLAKEQRPGQRIVIRDLVRAEWRNFFYSDDTPSDSSGRFRNRLELLYPINTSSLSDNGTIHFQSDWEWFIPLSDPSERFASRQRVRIGLGYRRSREWRYTAFYIRTRSRDTTDEPFTTSENIFNFQVKRVW